MPLCIICHLDIDPSYDVLTQCPNEHPVHEVCLKEWLKHSKTCPVCSEAYEATLLDTYKGYLQQQQKDKQDAIQQKQLQKTIEIVDRIARKMAFLKQLEVINTLFHYKRIMPERVVLLRGNHEDRFINRNYGFYDELRLKFSTHKELFRRYNQVFSNLPIAAVTWNKIFCVHGGVPEGLEDIEEINFLLF